jgi:hypothetical protein
VEKSGTMTPWVVLTTGFLLLLATILLKNAASIISNLRLEGPSTKPAAMAFSRLVLRRAYFFRTWKAPNLRGRGTISKF